MRVSFLAVSLLVVLLITAPREAAAQGLPLPRLDHVNIFVSAQKFIPGADLVRDEDGILYGWGFETSFEAGLPHELLPEIGLQPRRSLRPAHPELSVRLGRRGVESLHVLGPRSDEQQRELTSSSR